MRDFFRRLPLCYRRPPTNDEVALPVPCLKWWFYWPLVVTSFSLPLLPFAVLLFFTMPHRLSDVPTFLFYWTFPALIFWSKLRTGDRFNPYLLPSPNRIHSENIQLSDFRFERSKFGSRSGLVFRVSLTTAWLDGKTVEARFRLRTDAGTYLRSRLPRYAGTHGEILLSHAIGPLTTPQAVIPDLWVFMPFRALPARGPGARLDVVIEILLGTDDDRLHVQCDAPLSLVLTDDDLPPLPTQDAAQAPLGAIIVTDVSLAESGGTCGVCGDLLAASAVSCCPNCSARHHDDCWRFLGRCSVYGCPGRPSADLPS